MEMAHSSAKCIYFGVPHFLYMYLGPPNLSQTQRVKLSFHLKKAKWFDHLVIKNTLQTLSNMFRCLISGCIFGWLGNPFLITICICHFDSRVWVKFPSHHLAQNISKPCGLHKVSTQIPPYLTDFMFQTFRVTSKSSDVVHFCHLNYP